MKIFKSKTLLGTLTLMLTLSSPLANADWCDLEKCGGNSICLCKLF